jgi:hypothetical protein
MKRSLILALMIVVSSVSYAQDEQPPSGVLTVKQFSAVIAKDVYSFYDLASTYTTPLEKKTFEATQEYSDKIAQLNSLLDRVQQQGADIWLQNDDNAMVNGNSLGNYDLKKHAFALDLGRNFFTSDETPVDPNSIAGVHIKGWNYSAKQPKNFSTLINVPEDVATGIERNLDVLLAVHVIPEDDSKITFPYFSVEVDDFSGMITKNKGLKSFQARYPTSDSASVRFYKTTSDLDTAQLLYEVPLK